MVQFEGRSTKNYVNYRSDPALAFNDTLRQLSDEKALLVQM